MWLLGVEVAGRLGPAGKRVAAAALGLFVLLLVAVAFKLRMLLFFLAAVVVKLRASRPRPEFDASLAGLGETATVDFDQFGIPTVNAASKLDAMRALGYVTARDRLFQMDMYRRAASGRMSEVVGKAMLEADTAQRVMGFGRAAREVAARLPEDQTEALRAYAEGVNAYIKGMKAAPFEFQLLRFRPEPWEVSDSVLVLLQMFRSLCGEEEGKRRMLPVMERTLPQSVVAFLTPDEDAYATVLAGGSESHRPARPVPVAEMSALLRESARADVAPPRADAATTTTTDKKIVRTEWVAAGSNCWAVDASKTEAGRAILSNDMHTGLDVPNLWYRARLRYDGVDLTGVTIPGIPFILAGSNTHVAWGLTNMLGACLDLVALEIDPERPDHYRTPEGWRQFETLREGVKLKRGDIIDVEVRQTVWGPVLEKTVMGEPVALRWTALDPDCVDFHIMHMERARTAEEASAVVNRFGGPPLNVIVADESGRIAYTVCGRLPVREGNDGSTARSWADAGAGWSGYIPPDELPRVVEGPEGFLVSANNRSVGRDYPHVLGHGFVHSYRAYRIAERLRETSEAGEAEMFGLQFDTACHVYEFYRRLALEVLTDEAIAASKELAVVRRAVTAWDGRADLDSQGLVFLIHFKDCLAESVFTPVVRVCAEAEEEFVYAWPNLDTPLRAILTERSPELLPDTERHASWDSFILENLKGGVRRVKEALKVKSLENLNWGRVNRAEVYHPLARKDRSPLGGVLNMPPDPLPGCNFSVCASEPGLGASVRMVVSPGREGEGFMHIACGQSGHPLSDNYDDQQRYWVGQQPLSFLPGPTAHTLTLAPQNADGKRGSQTG